LTNKIQAGFQLWRHLGPGWLLYRAGYALRRKSGFLRRAAPAVAWDQVPAPALRLSPPSRAARPAASGAACAADAEAILRGEFRLFSDRIVSAGLPPDWHRNQLTGEQVPGQRHWTDLGDFNFGDIKGVWELSRFPWAFPLARVHARTGDARCVTAFWQLFADWCRHNPPNLGPNWMCGQEATFRLMAVVFAAENMGVPEEHRRALARFVVATGRRIAANLNYALSQKNNHGVSECVGLITVALLVPEHSGSAGWLARGFLELEAQLDELVYEDGGFAQHSLIYHRVLLHDLCWCRHRLALAGGEIAAWLDTAGKRAAKYLMALMDPATGLAPLYGANDGTNLLPLSDGEFLDLRPVVQMASAVFCGELPLPAGPWDEAAARLVPDLNSLPRVPWPTAPARWHAPVAGCYQVVQGHGRLFLRCPTVFRHRPSQADMLHADIWHKGRPIAMDGGSFSYNSTERFAGLGAARHHNGLTVDGAEPVRKFSRFLYLPWPAGEIEETEEGIFRARHDGYAERGIRWTREVKRHPSGSGFVVHDKVQGAAGHRLLWHWRLADGPWQKSGGLDCLEVRAHELNYRIGWTGLANGQSRLLRADETTTYGWWSPYYASARPCAALLLEAEPNGDVELVTEFRPLE
jgi:hypothetical protein